MRFSIKKLINAQKEVMMNITPIGCKCSNLTIANSLSTRTGIVKSESSDYFMNSKDSKLCSAKSKAIPFTGFIEEFGDEIALLSVACFIGGLLKIFDMLKWFPQ